MRNAKVMLLAAMAIGLLVVSCPRDEVAEDDLENLELTGAEAIMARARYQPFPGYGHQIPGRVGGAYNSAMISEPRTLNALVGVGDNNSNSVISWTQASMVAYDTVTRQWLPRAASFEVQVNADGTMDVIYTLRPDLYWDYYGRPDRRVPVTSWDYVFWHNEIIGDVRMGHSLYSAQFIQMDDGSMVQRTAHVIDDRTFRIRFPRVMSNPIFTSNFLPGPAHRFEPALRAGGPDGVREIFNISTDPRDLPSFGEYFVTEYAPGQRIVLERNDNFWEKDSNGVTIPYPERRIIHILPDVSTQYLMWQQGSLEVHGAQPEQLDEMIEGQSPDTWTVFHNGGAMGSNTLWTFNQNPINEGQPWYDWFTNVSFRHALSQMYNRERIANQVWRGLAMPSEWWFPPANPFYEDGLTLDTFGLLYNPTRAIETLRGIGMERDAQGIMRDSQGRQVTFDLSFPTGGGTTDDVVAIIVDEFASIGIIVNPVPTDFQRLVGQLMETFDWQTLIIGLTGGPLFPTQGTNVWLSNGNLHMWHPFQENATGWEARKDDLFRQGMVTVDDEAARPIWREFQEIMLYQVPLIYISRPIGFVGIHNHWDLRNFAYDSSNGTVVTFIFRN